ncbi:MAG TPA: YetF domain-containing protein [Actinomycetota bacterium]
MAALLAIDWKETFLPDTPLLEIIVRGTIVYLFIFLVLRVVTKRETGALGVTDLIVIVLIADAAQNAMSSDYKSIADGLVLVATIVFWDWLLAWLAFRFEPLARLIRPRKLQLIEDGRLIRRNMRKELITEEELRGTLRLQGMEDFGDVKAAFMESDGRISIIGQDKKPNPSGETEKERV